MNPIVHAELSWLAAQGLQARRDRLIVLLAGVAPDLDGLSLLAGRDAYSDYHHVVFHGVLGAIVTTGACAALARSRRAVAGLSLAAFHLHLLCDLAGSGDRGMGGEGWPISYWWPLSRASWFWDGQWDLASWQNTLIGLGATLACLAVAATSRRRTIVEAFSEKADARIVETIRARFRIGK